MILYNKEKDHLLKYYYPAIEGKAYRKEPPFLFQIPDMDASVIIPCYNSEKYLRQCLDSVLQQKTKYDYEILAINDGSTDGTEEILNEYCRVCSRLKVYRQDNKGYASAENTGIIHARGKYLLFLDSDDYLSPDYIEALLQAAIMKNADLSACSYSTFRDQRIIKNIEIKREGDRNRMNGCLWGKAFRRDLFEHILLPEGYSHADSIVVHLLFPQVKVFAAATAGVYYYRSNAQGVTLTIGKKTKALDTFYITDLMIDSVDQFLGPQYRRGQTYYRILLEQFYLNQRRVLHIPIEYQKEIFKKQADYCSSGEADKEEDIPAVEAVSAKHGRKRLPVHLALYEYAMRHRLFLMGRTVAACDSFFKIGLLFTRIRVRT